MNTSRTASFAARTAPSSADVPADVLASYPVTSALSCRETARLLRHMLARMPWAYLPFAQRQRLLRTLQNLSSDLSLVLLILEKSHTLKTNNPLPS